MRVRLPACFWRRRTTWWRAATLLFAIGATAGVSGCGSLGYFTQAAHGHFSMLAAAKPIDDVLADPQTAAALRGRLVLAREIRVYATRSLGLPDNASYTRYADLRRPFVVWNVFATPELSIQLKSWCYPVFGCAGYRGYFSKDAAEALGADLRAQGYDVNVGGVPAYSSLGWFNDPLLNTFIDWPEGELARLIFHELAHQVAYAKNDTVFNESFATAVERVGVRRWLGERGGDGLDRYLAYEGRRADFLGLLLKYRGRLAENYARAAQGMPTDTVRQRKAALFADLRVEYAQIKRDRWQGFAGYDRFFAQDLNGAHLAAVAAYNDWVPAFDALLASVGGDLPRFYAEVKRLAALAGPERERQLRALLP